MSSLGSFENLLDMSLVLVRNEGDCKERQIEEIKVNQYSLRFDDT